MRTILLWLVVGVMLLVLSVGLMLGAVFTEFPWLAGTAPMSVNLGGLPPTGQWPTIAPGQVPADQWQLIILAAQNSTCGVSAADLAAIAKTESQFGKNLLNPVSGAFGYGQFDAATWATFGSGNPNNPADALPAMARTLCARGYAQDRNKALNSYGGCVTANCLGTGTYTDAINELAATYLVAPASDVVADARTWMGVPYAFGGCTRAGVDCSCLTMLAYQSIGVRIDRTAQAQWNGTPRVEQANLRPGDLVFFANTYPSPEPITHVGIYEGNGIMINAPDTGDVVREMSVFTGFWGSHYAGAGRPVRR